MNPPIPPPYQCSSQVAVCLLGLHYAWSLTTLHQLSPSWPPNPIWTLWDVTVLHQGDCKMSALTRKSSQPSAPAHFTPTCPLVQQGPFLHLPLRPGHLRSNLRSDLAVRKASLLFFSNLMRKLLLQTHNSAKSELWGWIVFKIYKNFETISTMEAGKQKNPINRRITTH